MEPPPPTPPPPPSLNANDCLNSNTWQERHAQTEYGTHTPKLTDSLREKVCKFCNQKKPTSLEEQSFAVILANAKLTRNIDSALRHLPHRLCWLIGRLIDANLIAMAWQLLPFVAEYGENRPRWFKVDSSKATWLFRFRLACEVYRTLKPYAACPSAGISSILKYILDVNSTYKDFWYVMHNAISIVKSETENGCLVPFKDVMSADRNNVVLVSPELSDDDRLNLSEVVSIRELLMYSQMNAATPIVFKLTEFAPDKVMESSDIPSLLQYFDPEVIFSIDIKKRTWSGADLDVLRTVLLPCTSLTDIYLRQLDIPYGILEDIGPALHRLLSQHRQLKMIGLRGFQLAGTLASFPLPPVERLQLSQCVFTEEFLRFMTNREDLAFKKLLATSFFYDFQFPSLFRFLLKHTPELEYLGLECPTLSVVEICAILRSMAKFNTLRTLNLTFKEEIGFASVEKVIVDLMTVHSVRKLYIKIKSIADDTDQDTESRLNDAIGRSSKINHRPPVRLIMTEC